MSVLSQSVNLGEPARILVVFFDENHALETPTAATIVVRNPSTAATTTVSSPDSSITFAKTPLPLELREALADAVTRDNLVVTAADLSTGTGVLEYIHTPTVTGKWQYDIKATAPSVSVEPAAIEVIKQFA